MVQKVIEEVADYADEVIDLLLGVEFKLSRKSVSSEKESARWPKVRCIDLQK